MSRNIKSQFNYAINVCFEKGCGASKHSDKHNKNKGNSKCAKIYSYSTLHGRQDVARQFADFLKTEHSEIKMAYQITKEHVEEFIQYKKTECTTETLNTYRSNLKALGYNLNVVYKINVDFSIEKVVGCNGTKDIRTTPMDASDLVLLQHSYRKGTTGYNALLLAEIGGLRASEITKLKCSDIGITNKVGIIHIVDSKGKRNRDILINNENDIKKLTDMISLCSSGNERFVKCNTKSLHTNISRHMKQIGIRDKYSNQNFHSIRKMWSQKIYDEYRQNHTKAETKSYVSQQLGHGANRDTKTLQRYISHIW